MYIYILYIYIIIQELTVYSPVFFPSFLHVFFFFLIYTQNIPYYMIQNMIYQVIQTLRYFRS